MDNNPNPPAWGDESNLPTVTYPNSLPVYIGAYYGDSSTFDGKIDNIMFFDEAFTDERVAELYNSQKAPYLAQK